MSQQCRTQRKVATVIVCDSRTLRPREQRDQQAENGAPVEVFLFVCLFLTSLHVCECDNKHTSVHLIASCHPSPSAHPVHSVLTDRRVAPRRIQGVILKNRHKRTMSEAHFAQEV